MTPASGATVVVFARRPVPGEAKTRIATVLGVEATHRLYQAMVRDTLCNVAASGLPVLLVHTPGPWRDASVPTTWQRGDSFAARFASALAAAQGPTVLVGSDTPHLGPDILRRAADAARAGHVVVPSRRGGFSLYAAAKPWTDPVLWKRVFAEKDEIRALRALGAEVLEPAVPDLDEIEDLWWLRDTVPMRAAPETQTMLRGSGGRLDDAVAGPPPAQRSVDAAPSSGASGGGDGR